MNKIFKEVLSEIKPSKEEEKEVLDKIDKIIKKIRKAMPYCNVVLGGSGEKGTWLSRAHDADIFVGFAKGKYKSGELADVVEKKLKKIFKITRLHGSRDYFQTRQEGYTFEIVPIIDIRKADEALNITDISPLHAKWVKKHRKYADEIRLAKRFFKAAKIYGAESYINGFSGYICEIITIHYGGFENLVKAIAKWKAKVIIDTERYHKGKKVLFEMDKAKTMGPLVIIDPVQKSRNAAAAVSNEKFEKIVKYTKDYLKKPSKDFFDIKDIDINDLKKKAKNNEFFVFEVKPKQGKEDIIGCKLLKCFEHIKEEIRRNEFNEIYSDWEWQKNAYFYFIVRKERLPDKRTIKGPPKQRKYFVKQFMKKHKDVFEEGENLFAREKRKFLLSKELMKALLMDEYIKEKVKSIDLKKTI
ncbi:MAG: CCA tRNA nucleotidyltransferase [Nanoarchaeota archaeon]|nr:CCA tRNA nucleotidyltransferase [Nanoarchaeota archaeon]